MAFDRKKYGGNITASAKQSSMFIYKTTDTLADVQAADYWQKAQGNLDGNSSIREGSLQYADDFIMVSAADGVGIGYIDESTSDLILTFSEV